MVAEAHANYLLRKGNRRRWLGNLQQAAILSP